MINKEISADYWPIDKTRAIKLIPTFKLKDIQEGTKLYTIVGDEVIVGKDTLNIDVRIFGRSKFGKLIE